MAAAGGVARTPRMRLPPLVASRQRADTIAPLRSHGSPSETYPTLPVGRRSPRPRTRPYRLRAVRAALAERAPDVTGLSCLADAADAADQIFARAVADIGGALEVILPAAEYRAGLPAQSHPGYDAWPNGAQRG